MKAFRIDGFEYDPKALQVVPTGAEIVGASQQLPKILAMRDFLKKNKSALSPLEQQQVLRMLTMLENLKNIIVSELLASDWPTDKIIVYRGGVVVEKQ